MAPRSPVLQEAVVGHHLGGGVGVVPVLAHDHLAGHLDLAVLGDAHVGAGDGLADGAELVGAGQVQRADRRRLGHPPALEHRHAGGEEERQDLRGDRRRAGDGELDPAAEDAAHEGEHLAVDLLERGGLLGADVLATLAGLAHLQPEGDRRPRRRPRRRRAPCSWRRRRPSRTRAARTAARSAARRRARRRSASCRRRSRRSSRRPRCSRPGSAGRTRGPAAGTGTRRRRARTAPSRSPSAAPRRSRGSSARRPSAGRSCPTCR